MAIGQDKKLAMTNRLMHPLGIECIVKDGVHAFVDLHSRQDMYVTLKRVGCLPYDIRYSWYCLDDAFSAWRMLITSYRVTYDGSEVAKNPYYGNMSIEEMLVKADLA